MSWGTLSCFISNLYFLSINNDDSRQIPSCDIFISFEHRISFSFYFQLLAKYWGNFKSWYKEQPLNLIEHYYGTEYAFYFAWFGFYAKMLVPIGILSMLSSLFGLVTVKTRLNRKRYLNFFYIITKSLL